MKRTHQQSDPRTHRTDDNNAQSCKKYTQHEKVGHLKVSCREYDVKFPFFRQPKEIGCFSKDSLRRFHHDKRQLKFFAPPSNPHNCRFDLKHGYSNMIWKDRNIKEHLNNLLRWIMHNRQAFNLKPTGSSSDVYPQNSEKNHLGIHFESLNTDFFCWRGLLTHITCLPYENRDDLLVAVIKFRGSYFMCEFETERKKIERETETPRQKAMSAWGFKFEQYVTSDKPGGIPDINHPVNTNEEFGSVARSRLGSHSIVYGAEVDCIDPGSRHSNPYVELKTSRIIEAQRQYENFCKFKLIKWWAQSFLIGISRVVCGFRDDDGVVHKLQDYSVMNMPSMAQSAVHNAWKPAVCFNFLDSFLSFVKSTITEDNSRRVYLFHWQPGGDIVCEYHGEDPEFLFLPDWFIDWDAWDQTSTN